MRRAARRHVDLATPGPQHRNRQVRRRAEAEEADPLPALHARHPEAAKSDDAGAKQRRRVQIVQRIRQRKHEIGAGDGVLGIAAVDAVAGEGRSVAEVLHPAAAVRAGPIRAADPGDADTRARVRPLRPRFDGRG